MQTVIERVFDKENDGSITISDQPSTYEAAEKIADHKLDRRRCYAIIEGDVHCLARWSSACTGCCDDNEYSAPYAGGGCPECGYQGRIINSMWIPLNP